MLAMQVESERLLVIREVGALLPKLELLQERVATRAPARRSRGSALSAHENVTVISQFADEDFDAFVARVKGRVERDLASGIVFRGAVVATATQHPGSTGNFGAGSARANLMHFLAKTLARRPHGWLQIRAPYHRGGAEPSRWLDLVESAAQATPHLDVHIAFSAPQFPGIRNKSGKVARPLAKSSRVRPPEVTRFRQWSDSRA